MTNFQFMFTDITKKDNEEGYHTAGVYNWMFDEVKVFLPNIVDSFLWWLPDFATMFKSSFVAECEEECAKQVEDTLTHEYIHVSLCKTECPLNKQHNAIEAVSL